MDDAYTPNLKVNRRRMLRAVTYGTGALFLNSGLAGCTQALLGAEDVAPSLLHERKKKNVQGLLAQAARKINLHQLKTLENQLSGNSRGLIRHGKARRKKRQNGLLLSAPEPQQDESEQLLNDAQGYARSLGIMLHDSGMGTAIDLETPPLFTGYDYYPTDDAELDALIQQEDPELHAALLNNNTVEGPPIDQTVHEFLSEYGSALSVVAIDPWIEDMLNEGTLPSNWIAIDLRSKYHTTEDAVPEFWLLVGVVIRVAATMWGSWKIAQGIGQIAEGNPDGVDNIITGIGYIVGGASAGLKAMLRTGRAKYL